MCVLGSEPAKDVLNASACQTPIRRKHCSPSASQTHTPAACKNIWRWSAVGKALDGIFIVSAPALRHRGGEFKKKKKREGKYVSAEMRSEMFPQEPGYSVFHLMSHSLCAAGLWEIEGDSGDHMEVFRAGLSSLTRPKQDISACILTA